MRHPPPPTAKPKKKSMTRTTKCVGAAALLLALVVVLSVHPAAASVPFSGSPVLFYGQSLYTYSAQWESYCNCDQQGIVCNINVTDPTQANQYAITGGCGAIEASNVTARAFELYLNNKGHQNDHDPFFSPFSFLPFFLFVGSALPGAVGCGSQQAESPLLFFLGPSVGRVSASIGYNVETRSSYILGLQKAKRIHMFVTTRILIVIVVVVIVAQTT